MAKIRKLTGKNIDTTSKAKATTPTKTTTGKVFKKRVPAKTIIKSGEENLRVSANKKLELKCPSSISVCLKRITVASKINHNLNALQVQCKTSETHHKVIDTDNETKSNNIVMNSRRKATQNNTKKLLEKETNEVSKKTKNTSSNTIAGKSVLHVKDSNVKQNSCCYNKSKERSNSRSQAQSSVDCQIPVKPKRCLIKLQKNPTMQKITSVASATTSTPSTTRKCVVRLGRITNIVKTRRNIEKSLEAIKEDCVAGPNEFANTDSLSPNLSFNNVSILDNNKRKNFRKLSLTKSFKILEDNDNGKCSEISKASTMLNDKIQPPKRAVIKQISKLSLKGAISKSGKDKINKLKDTQNETHFEFSIQFNPARNSTLLELDTMRDTQRKRPNEEISKTSPSKNQSSFKNYVNKSDEIEKLLSSLDDEEGAGLNSSERKTESSFQINKSYRDKLVETRSNISNNNNKTNKFFHHKQQNNTIKDLKENSKTRKVTGCRLVRKVRSTKAKRDNVYEFFSQSQTSGSDSAKHVDPTADIVRKLIKEGKVQVATNFKGKGRPKFKPRVCRRNQTKPTAAKKPNQLKNLKQSKKVTFVENGNGGVDEDYFDYDHLDNDEEFVNLGHGMQHERQNISSGNVKDQEGTFSRLARSVLINQTDRSNSLRKKQSELLEKVRNIISTPKNKESALARTDLQTDLSPIAMPPLREKQLASPWRVNEDAYLPKTFNFSRSSSNLPSFSSDYIPSTPRKEMLKKNLSGFNQIVNGGEKSPIKRISNPSVTLSPLKNSTENMRHPIVNLSDPSTISSISSFSSNDSNAENMPPPKPTPVVRNENDKIFDSKQLPNPRRALENRSPLKAINILEIVHLPPYKQSNKTKNSDDIGEKQIEMFGFEGNLDESNRKDHNRERINAQPQNDNSKNIKKHPTEDMFGFEEYLSQTDISSQENVERGTNPTINEQNQTIHDKLQYLRKFKPSENERQKSVKQSSKYTIKNIPLFNDEALKDFGTKQRGIKEMLCSTLLDSQPSTSKNALNQLHKNRLKDTRRFNVEQDVDLSVLFADPEPETTFNESEAHRTYIRPHKRKRRLREDKLVMLLESDESGMEDNSAEQHQLSRESDKSMEKVSKKKRQHKVSKDETALNQFVKEFNELCKEIESEVLIIEKSA